MAMVDHRIFSHLIIRQWVPSRVVVVRVPNKTSYDIWIRITIDISPGSVWRAITR